MKKELEKMSDGELESEKNRRIDDWQKAHIDATTKHELLKEINYEQVDRLLKKLRGKKNSRIQPSTK